MRLETLLPLGKVDPGLRAPEVPLDLASIGRDARLLEEIGYHGMVVEETKDDPFILMALAAQATTKLRIGTSVAIAFPRSPTVTAMSAWTLSKLSKGRFTLGLGTQVKAHIERRYGLPWSPAGPWMREYVHAVRAVWTHWQKGAPLDIKGPHYNINLMVPLFNPGPIEHPDIPIHLARGQFRDVSDGRRTGRGHPAPSGVHAVLHREGDAARGARGRGQRRPVARPFPDLHEAADRRAANEAELVAQDPRHARAHLLLCLDAAISRGLRSPGPRRPRRPAEAPVARADVGRDAAAHRRRVLETFAPSAPTTRSRASSLDRYGGCITDCEFSIAVKTDADKEILRGLAKAIQSESLARARKTRFWAPSSRDRARPPGSHAGSSSDSRRRAATR